MRRKITLALLILVCFLLQCSVFCFFEIASVVPNILLILTISFGFMQGKKEGLLVGFFSGLLIDLFYGIGSVLGVYALIYMYLGFFSGFFCKVYFDEDVKVPMVMIAGSDLIYNTAVYLFLFLLRGKLNYFAYLRSVVLPELVYTVLVTIVLYRIFYRINKYLVKKEARGKMALWLRNY